LELQLRSRQPAALHHELRKTDTRRLSMASEMRADDERGRAGRFRDLALPYLDDVYSLARYLLGNAVEADDAVQECYLRAYRHFDTYRGPEIKPWLFAILRNVCHSARAKAASGPQSSSNGDIDETTVPVWSEPAPTPESEIVQRHESETIRELVAALPSPFREVIVLREIEDLSYREIADIVGVPVGTVMSRLARARTMLRAAWLAADGRKQPQ
jgi:RNA polymerase sigma-70 factor, ECF subfamily